MKKNIVFILALLIMAGVAQAKPAQELVDAVNNMFPSAEEHHGVKNSQHPLEMSKVHSFAVTRKGGIPAGTAFWFITKQQYDFRPFLIEDDRAHTFFGKPDVVLEAGTVMVVASTEIFRKTVQIKLLSVDVISERGGTPSSGDTRAAVALTFKFPNLNMSAADIPVVLDKIQQYIMPASSLAQANQIAQALQSGIVPVASKAAATKSTESVSSSPVVSPKAKEVPIDQLPQAIPHNAKMVHAGMSYDEVKKIKGVPLRTYTRSGQVVFDYNDHEIIFVQDKVYDIRWK